MLTFIEKLREEYATKHAEAQAVLDKAAGEERELTEDERKGNETLFARLTTINKTIEDQTKFAGLKLVNGEADTGENIPGKDEFAASKGADIKVNDDPFVLSEADAKRYKREMSHFAATGEMGQLVRRFATITTATGTGALLPRTILPPITGGSANAFRQAHEAHGWKVVETTTAQAMTIPVLDYTAGGVVAENATSDTDSGGITEKIDLTPKVYQSGTFWYSNLLLSANDFSVVDSTVPQLIENKEGGFEAAIAAAIIADSGITQKVNTSSTSAFTYTNLVSLNRKLPRRYDRTKFIVLGADAFSAAEGLLDENNRPVLILDPQADGLVRFNGTPVFRCDAFEGFGANKTLGVVGSLYGFRIRDVTPARLARYANYPLKPDQTGLNLFQAHGYGYAPSAMATLETPAS